MKVDCQAVMGITGGGAPDLNGGPAISAEYHAALERSVLQNFPGNNCINCMCHSTEDIYRWAPPPPPAFPPNHLFNLQAKAEKVVRGCPTVFAWREARTPANTDEACSGLKLLEICMKLSQTVCLSHSRPWP